MSNSLDSTDTLLKQVRAEKRLVTLLVKQAELLQKKAEFTEQMAEEQIRKLEKMTSLLLEQNQDKGIKKYCCTFSLNIVLIIVLAIGATAIGLNFFLKNTNDHYYINTFSEKEKYYKQELPSQLPLNNMENIQEDQKSGETLFPPKEIEEKKE